MVPWLYQTTAFLEKSDVWRDGMKFERRRRAAAESPFFFSGGITRRFLLYCKKEGALIRYCMLPHVAAPSH